MKVLLSVFAASLLLTGCAKQTAIEHCRQHGVSKEAMNICIADMKKNGYR